MTSNPASARLVGQRARPGRAGPDQHWPFRNYHVALSEGHLYLASRDAQHVSVFRTDDLAQVLAFDASSATPPRPPPPAAEEEPTGAGSPPKAQAQEAAKDEAAAEIQKAAKVFADKKAKEAAAAWFSLLTFQCKDKAKFLSVYA